MFADRYGMPFIAFRIGVRLREHGNRFGPWIPFGRWGQEMWVSDRDLCNAFERAVETTKSDLASSTLCPIMKVQGGTSRTYSVIWVINLLMVPGLRWVLWERPKRQWPIFAMILCRRCCEKLPEGPGEHQQAQLSPLNGPSWCADD
jgi:hypothetical protein